ncbi:hypothetical protein D0812_27445 [Vibrio owensii]|uniref:Uncharacterized protein n=1 Tax=Vibrio owensii TaxID=696485 RepID=A0AAP9GC10_9VIBR|nr:MULTISPECIES: hypothetical protein [Vibrio harveyi group]AYO18077.1 hypothetical protein D0812_27445 [Vibrio owensii]EHR5319979.1 hypothetical protein [Vibrio parahaemolyticus]MBE3866081.1 hypothetical protein [Vibrio parahaemolyticus]MCR9655103.1 hypothetical protein [Vibrio parahaemolyticus]QGH47280.1 hypothetical protein APZ19_09355 [Vibrio owensii]
MKNLIVLLLVFVSLPSFSQNIDEDYVIADMALARVNFMAYSHICTQKIENIELLKIPRKFYAAVIYDRIDESMDVITRRIKWKSRGESQLESRILKENDKIREYSLFYALLATDRLSDKVLMNLPHNTKSTLTPSRCESEAHIIKRRIDFVLQHDMDI